MAAGRPQRQGQPPKCRRAPPPARPGRRQGARPRVSSPSAPRAPARAVGTRPLAGLACAPSAAHRLRRDVQKSAPAMPTTAAGLTQPRFLPDGCRRVMRASTGAYTQFSGQIYLGCTCSGRHPNGAVPRSFVRSMAISPARRSASAPRSTLGAGPGGNRHDPRTAGAGPVLIPGPLAGR